MLVKQDFVFIHVTQIGQGKWSRYLWKKKKIKFLLLEGVHQSAVENLRAAGYTNIEYHKGALSGEELKQAIRDARFVGIRSRTHLTEEILQPLKN